jgi:hypothetical protein
MANLTVDDLADAAKVLGTCHSVVLEALICVTQNCSGIKSSACAEFH